SRQEKCTILLCTHRLEDAEKLCNKVMIINRGRRIVVGTLEELSRLIGKPSLIVLRNIDWKIVDFLKAFGQINEVKMDSQMSRLTLSLEDESAIPEIVKGIVYAGGMIFSVNTVHHSLEEVYLKLVKEELA
ncbi:MAG: hypothetical protein FGF52_05675, partial [Candidatus Brockarchaeota archaeon]|nr:hypothetical protein [Candidatus Brockarchaeota archaeon]